MESRRNGSAGRRLGIPSTLDITPRWGWFALSATSLGYVGLLIALAPGNNPAVPLLMAVPMVVAGTCFGLRATFVVTGLLLVATALVIETVGAGVEATVGEYQGIPILMLVLLGAAVGRLHDLTAAMAQEVDRARAAEMELQEAQARLQDIVNAKDELIASVGHELRTPLTAVLGFAELLRVGSETDIAPADRREMVEFIARESFELSGKVDDLLVAARIEIDRLEVTRVPTVLRAQVSQVLEGWDRSELPDIHVTGDDVRAMADPARVRQILRNLITNAVRYGGDRITVRVGDAQSGALVEVSDNGPGLPKSEWERIFEPHYKYHDEPNQPGSAGLGLTVSRGLAERMGGSLTYRFDGQQSRVVLVLPTLTDRTD